MYEPLNPALQELESLVLEFHDRTKKLKELAGQLGTSSDCSALRDEISAVREKGINLSKQIGQLCKEHIINRQEKVKQAHLASNFREVLTQFEKVNAEALEKEKVWIQIIRESVEDEEFKRSGTIKAFSSADPSIRQQSVVLQEMGCFSEIALESMQLEAVKLEGDLRLCKELIAEMGSLVIEQGRDLSAIEEHANVAESQSGKAVVELHKGAP